MASKNARPSHKQSGVGLLGRAITKPESNGNGKTRTERRTASSAPRNTRVSRKTKFDLEVYNNGSTTIANPTVSETLHPHPPLPQELTYTPEEATTFAYYVARVFLAAINFLKERQPKRQPTRVEKLKSLFEGREGEIIFFDEIMECFSGTKDAKNSAYSAIYFANKIFEEIGADLEIKQYICYRLVSKKNSPD